MQTIHPESHLIFPADKTDADWIGWDSSPVERRETVSH